MLEAFRELWREEPLFRWFIAIFSALVLVLTTIIAWAIISGTSEPTEVLQSLLFGVLMGALISILMSQGSRS